MEIDIRIEASGPAGCGKTYELRALEELLKSRGYRVEFSTRDESGMPPSEILELWRRGIWTPPAPDQTASVRDEV